MASFISPTKSAQIERGSLQINQMHMNIDYFRYNAENQADFIQAVFS